MFLPPTAASTFPSLPVGLSNRKCGWTARGRRANGVSPGSSVPRVVTFSRSASQTRVRKVGQSAVSSLEPTRRSVLVERADRRGFSEPSLKDPIAKSVLP